MMNRRTTVAKVAYWLAGELRRVKTYQRFYEFKTFPPEGDKLPELEHVGRHWFRCQWSVNLLLWSMHHDPEHWDHWALQHDECEHRGRTPVPCPECEGTICPWDQGNEESDEVEPEATSPTDTDTTGRVQRVESDS